MPTTGAPQATDGAGDTAAAPTGERPRWGAKPVLAARLAVPQQRHRLVLRAHLLARVSEGTDGPLTLVRGPAGAGKTFLVASWVAGGWPRHPVAWLSLDADVDAPGAFWAHFLQALEAAGVALPDIGVPARAEEIDRLFLAELAASLSELPGPVVVVLDDFDRIASQRVARQLDYVLTYAAPQLRLIVTTRGQLPAGFHRHRVAGETVEISARDLALTTDEASELLRLHGVDLPEPSVEALTERMEGWVTGLRISALALAHGEPPERLWQQSAGRHGDIAEFILAEVLDQQRPEVQDLLLRTSILERVHSDLADALTGRSDGEQILEELTRASTFVRLIPDDEPWYRYHQLFAEALQGRLRSTGLDVIALHRAASQWLADHDELPAAVGHAAACGDWQLAAAHMVDHLAIGQLLVGLETHRLAHAFADLPADEPSAEAALVEAALAMAQFDAPRCVAALDRAAARSGRVPEPRRAALLLGVACVRVIVSRLTGDLEAAEGAADETRDLMSRVPAAQLARGPELAALMTSSLGTMQLWSGRVEVAGETLRAALGVGRTVTTAYPLSNCLGQLAVVNYLEGDLRQARQRALESLELASRFGLSPAARVPVGHLAAALVAWEWDDLEALRSHTDQAATSVAATHDPTVVSTLALLRARHRLSRRQPAAALACLDSAEAVRGRLPRGSFVIPLLVAERAAAHLSLGETQTALSLLAELPVDDPDRRLALARIQLASGQPAAALDTLGDAPDGSGLPLSCLVRMNLVAAQARHATGETLAARRRLGRALEIARPQGCRRPFVDVAAWVRQMLSAERLLAEDHGWLGKKLVGAVEGARGVAAVPQLVVEELSVRELEVLRLVAQPMSSREAAEELHLSVNTVKTHLRSVYRKLAATSRTTAVRRARTLGLL